MRPPTWSSPIGVLWESGSERHLSTSTLKGAACGDGWEGWDIVWKEKGQRRNLAMLVKLGTNNSFSPPPPKKVLHTLWLLTAICTLFFLFFAQRQSFADSCFWHVLILPVWGSLPWAQVMVLKSQQLLVALSLHGTFEGNMMKTFVLCTAFCPHRCHQAPAGAQAASELAGAEGPKSEGTSVFRNWASRAEFKWTLGTMSVDPT